MRSHVVLALIVCAANAVAAEATEAPVAGPRAASAFAAERGQPVARVFLPRDYRGHDQVWQIAERSDGVLYFGNLDQVLEFDGVRWRSIPVPGGSYIRALYTDEKDVVWLAGVNELGYLAPGADGLLRFNSLRGQLPAGLGEIGTVWSVVQMPDGMYFQTSVATLRWDGRKFEVWRVGEQGVVGAYRVGERLIVSREDGWYTPQPGGTWEKMSECKVLPRALWRAEDGRLLALTGSRGIVAVEGERLTPVATELDEWLRTKRPYSACELPGGRRVLTSLQGAAVVVDEGFRIEATYDGTAGVPSETVITAHLDRFGGLWLGTDNGVVRLDYGSPVRMFGPGHGLGRSGPESVARAEGRVLVSTARSILELVPPEKFPGNPSLRETKTHSDRVTDLVRMPDGVLASGLEGLTWISGGETKRLEAPPIVRNVREVVQLQQQPDRLVATFINGLVSWRREGAGWRCEGVWPELSGELRSLTREEGDVLWVATPNSGVIRIEPALGEAKALRIERLGEEAGLPVGRAAVWLNHVGGAPLFKTRRGMYRWDEQERRFRPENGFGADPADSGDFVRLSSEDDHGGLWMAVENRSGEPAAIAYGRAGAREQLPMPQMDRIGSLSQVRWERHEGRELLWVVGQSELRRVDLAAWRARPAPPPVRTLLREVQAGRERRFAPTGPAELGREERKVRFTFATPGWGGEPGARHESRLLGFAEGEVEWSTTGERTFTNLPAGSYIFEARARSEDGRWSEPVRFEFKVLAPWWQTLWAVGGYLVAGTVGLFVYVRWRLRRLLRERTRLEDVITQRTAELAGKNRELERLHRLDQDEKLAARLAEEKAQLELLRYQLNPHFLYNSLNSIRALVYTNAEAAGEMVTRLSEFCRWTLTRGADGMTTVAEEVEMLQAYLDIERTRWQEGLVTRIHVEPEARLVSMPQFLFLPLIENAIKYGGRTSPSVLEVAVTIRLEGEMLVGEIANTGIWVGEKFATAAKKTGDESTHIGLENLRRRLARYYGPQCRPHIVTEDGWVRLRLRLPLKTRQNSNPPL